VDTLTENRDAFDRLAELLIEREEVPGDDVLHLVNGEAESIDDSPATNGTTEVQGEGDDTPDAEDQPAEEVGVVEDGEEKDPENEGDDK